jgi:hypothetical protein
MNALFNKIGTLILVNGRHKMYMVEWEVVKPIIQKWSCNREPDMERVKEIKSHIENGGYVPLILHVADTKEEGLVCYDGNHRREALNILSKPPTVILDVLCDASKRDIYNEITQINKSVPVPTMYVGEDGNNIEVLKVRDQITCLVKRYESKYKSFASTSSRCHAPNFNRDMFMENILEIWKDMDGVISIDDLDTILQKINIAYSEGRMCRPHHTYRPQIVQKCKEGGLWLFIDRKIPSDHVKVLYNPFT